MDKEQLITRTKHPQYIPGIYNYCDRWCERCPFTSRCLNYDSTDDSTDQQSRDIHNRAFWDRLGGHLELAMEMLKDLAEQNGIDLHSISTEEFSEREELRAREAEEHVIAEWSRQYIVDVDDWFEDHEDLFKDKGRELLTTVKLDLPGADPETEASALKDCVEVIRWYQIQIHVKLMRGIMSKTGETDEGLQEFPRDSDGSAKVALIGLDRSIAAWTHMRDFFPSQADALIDIIVMLDRIRKHTECEFPDARAFIRPGFDTFPDALLHS